MEAMSTKDARLPIAVFDSGMGGVSVLRALRALMPHENYLYFGDSANAPYGVRPTEEILDLSKRAVAHLVEAGIKALVIGCNTVTSVAAETLRAMYPELIIVATEPAVKPAALKNPGGVVLVMATDATIRGEKLRALIHQYEDRATILKCPCPGLMEFVERGDIHSDALRAYLRERFAQAGGAPPDAVVLGCTHYPFVRGAIRELLGPDVQIFDPAPGIAQQAKHRLEAAGLLNGQQPKGIVTWENSAASPEMIALGKRLLEMNLDA